MATKTKIQVTTTNPTTQKSVTKTAAYSNPNATDKQLSDFAHNFYGGLSADTVDSVKRIDKTDITNATNE